jgi:hypothetical protein
MSFNPDVLHDIMPFQKPWYSVILNKMQNRWEIRIEIFMIEMSLEKMKGINKLGRKNVWNKAKLFPPLEEQERKSAFNFFCQN